MSLQSFIDRMQELHEKATEEPWWYGTDGLDIDNQVIDKICSGSGKKIASWLSIPEDDGELICKLRSNLTTILKSLELMQKSLEHYALSARNKSAKETLTKVDEIFE